MSDLQVEATPATRGASATRSGRSTARERTDVTATFDQIFAAVAQIAPRATPQPAPIASVHAELPEPLEPVVSPVADDEPFHEEAAVDEVEPTSVDAPPYAASPALPKSPEHRDRRGEEPQRDRVEPSAPVKPIARDRHAAEQEPAHSHVDADRATPRTAESPRKPATPSKGKETTAAPQEHEASDRRSDTKARTDRAESSSKQEKPAALQSSTVAPESPAPQVPAETVATAVAVKAPHEAPAVVPVTTVVAKHIESPSQQSAPREGRKDRPTKQSAPKPDAPPLSATKPSTSARPATDTPTTTIRAEVAPQRAVGANAAESAQHVEPAIKPEAKVKTAASGTENAAPIRGEHVEPIHAAPAPKAEAGVETQPTIASKQVVAQQDAKPTAAPTQARAVETSIAAGALPETPTAERRRPRESRPTAVANVEARNATPSALATPASAASANPNAAPQASASVVNQVVAPVVIAPTAAPSTGPQMTKPEAAPVDRSRANPAPTAPATESRERTRVATEDAKPASVKRVTTDPQHEVDRVRLIQRVAKALQTAQDRGGTLRIRLTPPELGALKIELIVRDGALSARLEAETPAAKAAILESLPALRERLTSQEIKIERFDVDLMQQSDHSGGERHSFADAESSREQADLRRSWRSESSFTKPAAAQPAPAAPERTSNGGLNVLA